MKKAVLIGITLLLTATAQAFAAGAVEVKVGAFQARTITANGKTSTQMMPLEKALPGETVTYLIDYINNGKEAADSVVIHDPIPAQMSYVADTAKGDNTIISYSVDGGKKWAGKVIDLKVPGKDGKLRVARAEDVTTLRWQVKGKVAPGSKGQVQFDAVLK